MNPDLLGCDAAELAAWLQGSEDLAVLDVREPYEFDAGHLSGACLLWPRTLERRLSRLVPSRHTRVVLYDDGASRRAAHRAADCHNYGYRNVRWLRGGLDAGVAAGLPVATGTNVPSKAFGETLAASGEIRHLQPSELARWLAAGDHVRLFDVRTAPEFESGHIPGALNLSTPELALRIGELHDARVVVNCAGRTRSLIAAATLERLGVKDVSALENGTMGWLLEGQVLEQGPGAAPDPTGADSLAGAGRAAQQLIAECKVDRLEAADLSRLLGDPGCNAYFLDVRQDDEYADGHPVGAVSAPGGQLIQRADDFIAVRTGQVVLCDDNEIRAAVTAYWLRRMGHPNVAILAGGVAGWEAAGLKMSAGGEQTALLGWDDGRTAPSVGAEELASEIGEDTAVVNVDSSARFASGHVPGSRWVPRGWLEHRLPRVLEDHAGVVLTCRDGVVSRLATASLVRSGHPNVWCLDGGMAAWIRVGLPYEKGPAGGDEQDVVRPPYERGEDAMKAYLQWEVALADPGRSPGGGSI